ncbi:Peptidyl-prolyl cis-trans isomerase pin4 protein [Rutstroemia sp. NJR-2017a BBW]|nr:Peptidyl-prolyl cis-trans isomerase pin4 protein [Rutstroemia sp. NJR-2017a BBW]
MPPNKKNAGKAAKGKGKDDAKDAGAGKETKVKGAQQINVRHILCAKQSRMTEALQKLSAGAKFDDVAREFSEDKARAGGSLGWKGKGDLDPDFEKVAFEMESSTTANPKYKEVKTGFGYHIIMVEGRK